MLTIGNDGGGSALLKNTQLCREIFEKTRKVLKIPFTIKMRAGWDKHFDDSLTIAKIAQDCGVDAVTLHARTRAQGYSGSADWDLVKSFKQELKIPVIGNGDIKHFSQVNEMMEKTGCDGVMIGRAGIAEPWFFKSYLEQKEYQPTPSELKELILKQYEDFFDYFGQDTGLKQMRKHICAYTKGLRNGGDFRNRIVRMNEWDEVRREVESFLN